MATAEKDLLSIRFSARRRRIHLTLRNPAILLIWRVSILKAQRPPASKTCFWGIPASGSTDSQSQLSKAKAESSPAHTRPVFPGRAAAVANHPAQSKLHHRLAPS